MKDYFWKDDCIQALKLIWHMDDFGDLVCSNDPGLLMGWVCGEWTA